MISSDQAVKMIFERFPDFKASWNEYIEYWKTDSKTIYTYMSAFTDYVTLILKENNKEIILREIFSFVEFLLEEGESEVAETAATCFLENLINIAASGDINPAKFVKLLGKKSKEYCQAWDEFCGVKTEGIWDVKK